MNVATLNLRAPIETQMFDKQGSMSRPWQEFFATMPEKLSTAIGVTSSLVSVAAGSDASDVDAITADSGSDSVDLTTLNASLSTLTTQINAIVAILNELKDKLVETNLMTS